MSKVPHISIIDKLACFLEIYESTFGQSPTAVLLTREQIKEYVDAQKSLMLKNSQPYLHEPVKPINYDGVLIQSSQKQRIEEEREELKELRKLKESLENIKSVLKV